MKKLLLVLGLMWSFSNCFAAHISGGEMFYEYIGPGATAGTSKYRITLKLFRDDRTTTGAAMPINVFIGIFNNNTLAQYPSNGTYFDVSRSSIATVPVTPPSPCMENPPTIEYSVGTYTFSVDLPNNTGGYTAAYQTCCRINSLTNVFTTVPPGQGEGSTYSCTITPNVLQNSSPQFVTELAAVCYNSPFKLNFGAIDPNPGDSLVYAFCNAFDRGVATAAANVNPSAPPFQTVSYINGFSGTSPLGSRATIDPKTGLISGIAPEVGQYVVCVCIQEYRNGVLIGFHRKDFILKVEDCSISDADLLPKATTCDGFTVYFQNDGSNSNVEAFYWEFGEPASGAANTSNAEAPSHDYLAPGIYKVKLVVNRNQPCSDSAEIEVKVFPGFSPALEALGKCTNIPIQFNDKTIASFGSVNSWSWNFGDFSSTTNTSTLKNPTHIFTTAGEYSIRLIVGSSVGCIDTVEEKMMIYAQPPLSVSNDTLICSIDTLQLNAVGDGALLWQPNYMINDITSHTPLVSPDVTTKYFVHITDPFGCTGIDSVTVKVVNFVTLIGPKDTTICGTDDIVLRTTSDALQYTWTSIPNDPSISDTTAQSPTATPITTTTYHVRGNISNKCFADDDITVKVVAYPVPAVGPDVPVCFGFSTQLNASGGAYYNWTPAIFLSATNIPDPRVVNPTSGVTYIVSVRDTLGCPKAVRDTIRVDVIRLHAYAGADTSVVLGQPLQLNATGGTHYLWETPTTWLSAIDIHDPVSLPQNDIRYFVTVSDDNGCKDRDDIFVRLYRVDAGLYVPNAFTPNGDTKNDIFQPIELGLKTLDLFRVYNRWGELLYSTTDMNKGWDGTYKGKGQDPATYVWYAEGTDYTGKKVQRKGTVILIRQ